VYGKASEPRTIIVATTQAGRRPAWDPGRVDVPATVRLRVRHGRAPAAERQRPGGTPVAPASQPAVAGGVEVLRRAGRLPRRAQEEATSAPSVRLVPPTQDGLGPASAPWRAVEGTPASIAGIPRCTSLTVGRVPRPAGMPPSTPSAWSSAGQAEEAAAAGSGWMPGIVPPHRLMPAAGARRRIAVTGEKFCAGAACWERRGPRGPAPRVGLAGRAGWGLPGPAAEAGGPRR